MFLFVDKPKGMTSHDVIDVIRRITGERKVGHAGTLDPNATGLLIVAVGRASTKRLGSITTETTKTYVAEVILGEERDTDDVEGHKVTNTNFQLSDNDQISTTNVKKILNSFLGKQEQIPPIYSAIKMKGKKAYELARKGKDMKMKPRQIEILSIKLIDYEYPKLEIDCVVSSGTYIRALARDIGRKIETYGYLGNLRRTAIGEYSIENATVLDEITSANWGSLGIEL